MRSLNFAARRTWSGDGSYGGVSSVSQTTDSKSAAPLQRKSVLNALHRTQRRAKLRKLDVKALRHSFASLLIAAGRSVTEVQYLMGHANPTVTLRVYSHWFKRTETTGVADLARAILGTKPAEVRPSSGHSADADKTR